MSDAETALNGVNISIKDMAGNVRPVQDILTDLSGSWSTLSDSQRQNMGVTLAGRFQLSRFLALMNNWELATDATATAIDSQGSSMREQAKYANSYEGRLNRLDTAWNKLVLSSQEAVLGSGLIAGIEGLNNLSTVMSKAVDTVGLLGIGLGVLGTGITLFTTKLKVFTTSLIFGTAGMTRAQLVTAGLTTGMSRAAVATVGLGIAFKGLLASTGIGLLFLGLGFAIEKLINNYGEAKRKTEEFEAIQNKNAEALTTNKKSVEGLIASYKSLSSQKVNDINWDSTKQQEYLETQNKLAEMFPTLIDHIDATGQNHLKTAEEIDKEVTATEKLIQLKKEELQLDAEKRIADQLKEQEKLRKAYEEQKKGLEELNNTKAWNSSTVPWLDSTKEKLKKDTNEIKQGILSTEGQLAESSMKMVDEVLTIADAFSKIEIDSTIKEDIENVVSSIDFSGLDKTQLKDFSKELATLTDDLQKSYDSGDSEGFTKTQKAMQDYFASITQGDNGVKSFRVSLESLSKKEEQLANMTYSGADGMDSYSNSMDEASDSASNLAESQSELKTATERLMGVSSGQIDSIYEMIGTYQLLSQMESLSADQKTQLAEATSYLAGIYPDLVNGSNANIEMMKSEIEATDVLRQAIDKMANGEVSAQDAMTISAAIGTKNRLNLLRKEIQEYNKAFADMNHNANSLESEKLAMRKLPTIQVDIDSLMGDMETYTSTLSNSLDINGKYSEAAKKAAEEQKKLDKELERSIYLANKYAEALEKISTELDKQNAIKNKHKDYSQQYQKALKNEISLLTQQKKLMEEQSKSLNKQIKSGNINQYGVVTSPSSTSSGSSLSTSSLNGGSYSGKYAKEINAAASKYGISPFLVASIIQAESSFNPNARSSAGAQGLMQLMPSTAKGLGVTDSYDSAQNIMGGTKYIAQQIAKFGGDIEKALWAYNVGAGNVSKILNSGANSWTGVKSYADKILSAFNKTSKGVATASQSVADYYQNNFRTTSTFGQQESFRNSPHKGLDLANGKQGDLVKALSGGKVVTATYSKSAGNWVVIQQDDGTVAKYMHMQNGLSVKSGQRVEAGQTLGKVGNTGESTGAHLHIQVEQNGKAIDPQAYMQTTSKSKEVAENLSNIDQAASEARQLQSDLLAIEQQIADLQYELVMSVVSIYDKREADADYLLATIESKLNDYDSSTQSYRNVLRQTSDALYTRQRNNASEIAYLESVLKKNNLTPAYLAEITAKLRELKLEREAMFDQQKDLNSSKVDSYLSHYSDLLDDVNDKLDLTTMKLGTLEVADAEYGNTLADQIALLDERQEIIALEIKTLEQLLKTQKLSIEKQKEIKETLEDLNKESKQAEYDKLAIMKDTTNKGIDILKNAMEKRRDIETAALQKELDEYEKYVNRKLDLMDKEYEEDNFNKDLSKLQDEEKDILARKNRLMLDDSQEAMAKRIELEEQLKEIQEQIAQSKVDRERDLRKESLEEELDLYKESTEDQIDEINYKYNEMLADEQYFSNLYKEIMSGNVDVLENELSGYLTFFKNQNQDVIKELGMSWQELQNMINEIMGSNGNLGQIGMGNGSNSGTMAGAKKQAWNQYIENKRVVETGTGITPERLTQVKEENEMFRSTYGFADGSYYDLIKENDQDKYQAERKAGWQKYLNNKRLAETGNPSPDRAAQLKSENSTLRSRWSFPDGRYEELKKLTKYHEGGIVGQKPNRLTEIANKLFNVKPNEQVIKSLKGELQVPPKNIPNLFSNISNMISGMIPSPASEGGINLGGINIENFNGSKQDLSKLGNDISSLINNLKNKGKI